MAELNEVVAEAAEQVASEAIGVATVARSLSGRDLTIGLVIGAAVGAGISFLWTRRKLETKYAQIAEEEISAMGKHFRARLLAREEKPDLVASVLEKKTEELGYSSPTGPQPDREGDSDDDIVLKPPVPVSPRPQGPNRIHEALEVAQDRGEDQWEEPPWSYDYEKAHRQHRIPYVIHFDERGEAEFDTISYTYYEGDDVVCDDTGKQVEPRDEIVGDQNLDKFGHGSGDPNVVYIRNDHLALEISVTRDPGSFAEEVHGIKHSDGGIEPRRRRPRGDDQ